MKQPLPISEEMLNAFIDDELEANDRDFINKMESTNKELAKAISKARRLKALVKLARTKEPLDIEDVAYNPIQKKRQLKIFSIAASIVLALSVTLTSVINENYTITSISSGETYKDSNSLFVTAKDKKNINLVLHLKSSQPEQTSKFFKVLNSTLQTSSEYKNNLHVEIIFSGPGLNLLQIKNSEHAYIISEVGKNSPHVTFIACGNTLQKLQEKSNENIKIIKEAMLVSSGPIWAEKRQRQGWSYFVI